jgi:hypothetical protein
VVFHRHRRAAEFEPRLSSRPLLSQAVDAVLDPESLEDPAAPARGRRAELGIVLVQDAAVRARDRQRERRMADGHAQAGRRQAALLLADRAAGARRAQLPRETA